VRPPRDHTWESGSLKRASCAAFPVVTTSQNPLKRGPSSTSRLRIGMLGGKFMRPRPAWATAMTVRMAELWEEAAAARLIRPAL